MSGFPHHERGAALLAVLLLVAVIGAIAAGALEKLRLSTALSVNAAAADQARAYAIGVEQLMLLAIGDLVRANRTAASAGQWNGAVRRVPLPEGGLAKSRLADGGNCFNINSLVTGGEEGTAYALRPLGRAQFAALMTALGLGRDEAGLIADRAAEWILGEIEDPAYRAGATPYRTGGTLFADPSELRALAGMRAETYALIAPWLCALPSPMLSPINPNTLNPDQAPLLAILAPGRLGPEDARRFIAARPPAGWRDAQAFFDAFGPDAAGLTLDALEQPRFATRWFRVDTSVELAGATLRLGSLVDARSLPPRVATRAWGMDR